MRAGRPKLPPHDLHADQTCATADEVKAAICSLSKADRLKLKRVSRLRAVPLAARGVGVSDEDLLQEAVRRTVDLSRPWKKNGVKLMAHLVMTMWSIASDWARKDRQVHVTEEIEERLGATQPEALRSRSPIDPERDLGAHELFARIREEFQDDDEVQLVLTSFESGEDGPGVRADLGLSQSGYDTIMKRIRRRIDEKWGRSL